MDYNCGYIPLVLVITHCESKLKNKIYNLGKSDDRIPILQLDSTGAGAKKK